MEFVVFANLFPTSIEVAVGVGFVVAGIAVGLLPGLIVVRSIVIEALRSRAAALSEDAAPASAFGRTAA